MRTSIGDKMPVVEISLQMTLCYVFQQDLDLRDC